MPMTDDQMLRYVLALLAIAGVIGYDAAGLYGMIILMGGVSFFGRYWLVVIADE